MKKSRTARLSSGPSKEPASLRKGTASAEIFGSRNVDIIPLNETKASPDDLANEALILRIRDSSEFFIAEKSRNLLGFLYLNRGTLLQDKTVAIDFFGKDPESSTFTQDCNSARAALGEIRERLEKYAKSNPHELRLCELPAAKEVNGYRLRFGHNPISPAECFWRAHQEHIEDTDVITGSHLFFFDPETNTILRYYDFNAEGKGKRVTDALKTAHPELANADHFQPWHNTYLATGDVQAYEKLVAFLHERTGKLIKRLTSRDIVETALHRRSPILIGRPQTNPFIESMMGSHQAREFGYRIHEVKGTIQISSLRDDERASLSKFPITSGGIVGPVTEHGKVFGIMTRMPNPSARGPLTIFSCDYYAMVIARIVEMVTSDSLARKLLGKMKWPSDLPLPERFEILFVITLTPGGLEGEGDAEFVSWRNLDV